MSEKQFLDNKEFTYLCYMADLFLAVRDKLDKVWQSSLEHNTSDNLRRSIVHLYDIIKNNKARIETEDKALGNAQDAFDWARVPRERKQRK